MSSVPASKDALIRAISTSFEKLYQDYSTIPDSYTRLLGVEGNAKGTVITVCDTLGYLIGWAQLVLKWYRLKADGRVVVFPEVGFKWNQLGLLAGKFYSQYADWSFASLQDEFASVIKQILLLVESLPNQKLYGECWYETYTLGRMIQFNTSSPMKSMRTKVRRFKRQNGLL